MVLFEQKDFARMGRCLAQGEERSFKKTDAVSGLRATVIVGPAGPVWEKQSGISMLATIKIDDPHHGSMIKHCSSIDELKEVVRGAGL